MELHYRSLKVVKFMMEFHYGNSKEGEASVGASPWRLPHPCELVSGYIRRTSESQNKMGVTN